MTIHIDDDLRSQVNCSACLGLADSRHVSPGSRIGIPHYRVATPALIATDGEPLVQLNVTTDHAAHLFVRYRDDQANPQPYFGRINLCAAELELSWVAQIARKLGRL